jgi:probable HAF family extracellular repeat protein
VWRNGRLAGLGVGTNPFNGAAYPALNDRGQVVGMGENLHAFLWQDARVSDLGSLPGRPYSDAVAINDRGQVVGRSYVATNEYDERIGPRAFLWSRGKMRDLGALPGDTYSTPDAINERGQIIGRSYPKSAKFSYGGTAEFEWWEGAHAFVWENGKMARLAGTDARVSDINDRGQIVGSVKRSGRRHAVLWRDGKMIDLGLLPGRSESQASAVNERGQVIGTSGQRAFVWQNGKMTALPVLAGMTRYSAVDINERGEVLGTTLDKRGEPQMVLLWTPKR